MARLRFLYLALWFPFPAFVARVDAAATLVGLFTDGVVLPRDRPVPIWGRAAAGERTP